MKIKLLLAPSLIIGTIVLLIWFVYPGYTNGGDASNPVKGIREKIADLDVEREKLAKMEEKNKNMKNLSDQLIRSDREQKILVSFIPETVLEEEIVDKLNFNASSIGVSVFDLSITQPKVSPAAIVPPVIEDETGKVNSASSLGIVPLPTEESVEVSFSVIGNYDKIKELLEKIYRLKRFNEVASLKVSAQKSANPSEDKNGSSENLQAEMTLNFNVLKNVMEIGDPEGKVFSMENFDMGTISKIEETRNVDVPEPLRAGESGRANPFRL